MEKKNIEEVKSNDLKEKRSYINLFCCEMSLGINVYFNEYSQQNFISSI